MHGDGVGNEGAEPVLAVGRQAAWGVAPHERSHRAETAGRERRQQVTPGVGGVGKAVQAESQWALAGLEEGELDAVGVQLPLPHRDLRVLTLYQTGRQGSGAAGGARRPSRRLSP